MRQTMQDAAAILAMLIIGFMSAAPISAHGAPNVFDDAVFWFRGGKDKNGDGYMRSVGEFFDDLHADDTTHANHQAEVQTYTSPSLADGFKANAVFRTERVVFPALGTAKNMPVLHLSNNVIPYNSKNYYWPQYVKPYSIFADSNISNEYTIVSRMRLDYGGSYNKCFVKVGYDSSNRQGMWLGFAPSHPDYPGCMRVAAYRTPNSGSSDAAVLFNLPVPTNTWVDLAVVVGNGKMRVGVATPASLSSHNNNPTIAFDQASMWTDNCTLLGSEHYKLFCKDGQETYKDANNADTSCFLGSVQQLAIWGRALSDQEVMAAFGMPRPALFRTGFDNGASSEFGGTRSGATQTIDGLGSWQNIANTMKVGDTWTVNFTALRDEAGLPQIFSIKSLPDSATATIEPILNNQSLGEMRIAKNGRAFWPVPKDLIVEGDNTLVIERKNGGASVFKMDAMELGGALGVGTRTASSTDDGRVHPERIKTGVPSAADPNTQHWPMGLMPSTGVTNLHFRVWIDPEVADKGDATFTFKTATRYNGSSAGDFFSIYINEVYKTKLPAQSGWKEQTLSLQPADLHGGWNDLEFICTDDLTCYWDFGYYSFETVLSSAFSFPTPPGLSVIFR